MITKVGFESLFVSRFLVKPTLNNDRGKCRQLSLGVHGRDAILRRVIKIASERGEHQVINVHDTHILSPKDSRVQCPSPTSTSALSTM